MGKKRRIYSMHERGCDFAGEFAYMGRTTQTLNERLRGHKNELKSGDTSKVHQYVVEKGLENFTMTLLEEFEETIEGESEFCELWWSMWLGAGLSTRTPGVHSIPRRGRGIRRGSTLLTGRLTTRGARGACSQQGDPERKEKRARRLPLWKTICER